MWIKLHGCGAGLLVAMAVIATAVGMAACGPSPHNPHPGTRSSSHAAKATSDQWSESVRSGLKLMNHGQVRSKSGGTVKCRLVLFGECC